MKAMTQMLKNLVDIYTILHTSQSLNQVYLPELWITKCGSKLIYETLQGKKVVYVLPIPSILGRLPVVRAGDTNTIPFCFRSGYRNSAHDYNHDHASADSSSRAGDG